MRDLRRWCLVVLVLAALSGCRAVPCAPSIAAKPLGCSGSWAGIYPTTLAAWTCAGQVDREALIAQIEDQWAGGVTGLLVLGTLGEGESATDAERELIIATAVQTGRGRGPVIVGIHAGDTATALAHLEQAARLGAAAVLVKVPGPRPFAEVRDHVAALAGQNRLPVFYYHYPQRTRLRLTPCQVAELLLLPGVVGIKESTLNLAEVRQHVALTQGKDLTFLSGTALNLTQFLAVGGHGAMCPEAVLVPRVVAETQALAATSPAAARQRQKQLFACAPVLMGFPVSEGAARRLTMTLQDHHGPQPMLGEPEPARLKLALSRLGVPMTTALKAPFRALKKVDEIHVERAVPRLMDLRLAPCDRIPGIPALMTLEEIPNHAGGVHP